MKVFRRQVMGIECRLPSATGVVGGKVARLLRNNFDRLG
jgi:hypothetical protein